MSGNIKIEENSLYPMMHEIPRERISFIWKVCSIITFQLLLTIVVVSAVMFVPPVINFFNNNIQDDVIETITFFAFFSLFYYHKKCPLNYFFLLMFTVSVALSVGLTCALVGGTLARGKIIILEIVTLTTVVVINSSLYTFWTIKQGRGFISLSPFLFRALLVLFLVGLIQILFFSLEKLSAMIYGCLVSIIIFGYSIHITYNLIKCLSCANYIWVSASLYSYVISIFLCLVLICCVAEFIQKK